MSHIYCSSQRKINIIVVAHSLTFLLSMILGHKTRQVYWDINLRAAVGETILHLCFLNATRVHYDLSKMIIKRFPNLVNDIYLSDEYYGKFHEKNKRKNIRRSLH